MMKYETFNQKKEYYNIQFIENEVELDTFLNNARKNSIWRGLSNAEFMIFSTLQREWQKSNVPNTKENQRKYLSENIHNAAKWNNRFFSRYFRNMGLKKGPTILSLLSFLRHYEVPSPLIDFTRDINIGLYFAAKYYHKQNSQNEVDDYFSLVEIPIEHFLNSIDFKKKLLERYEQTNKKSIEKLIVENKPQLPEIKYKELLISNCQDFISKPEWFDFWYFKLDNPPERIEDREEDLIHYYINTNPKITNQLGLFIINMNLTLPLEQSFIEPLNKIISLHKDEFKDFHLDKEMLPKFNIYEINSSLKEYALKKLELLNYNSEYIFPDYESFKKHLKPIEEIVCA